MQEYHYLCFAHSLSHTYPTWHSTAIQLPLLWTDIKISAPWNLRPVKTYLPRSDPCSIEVKLRPTKITVQPWPVKSLTAGFIFGHGNKNDGFPDDIGSSGMSDLWNAIAPHISIYFGHEFKPLFMSVRAGM
jgi:hypothetical protein